TSAQERTDVQRPRQTGNVALQELLERHGLALREGQDEVLAGYPVAVGVVEHAVERDRQQAVKVDAPVDECDRADPAFVDLDVGEAGSEAERVLLAEHVRGDAHRGFATAHAGVDEVAGLVASDVTAEGDLPVEGEAV